MKTKEQTTIYDRICAHLGKLSVSQLEKECGFSNGTISKWKEKEPSAKRLFLVSEKLGVSVAYLLGEEECPVSQKNFSEIFNTGELAINSPNSQNKTDTHKYNEAHNENLLIFNFRKLSEEAQRDLMIYCNNLVSFGESTDIFSQKRSYKYINLFRHLIASSQKFWELSVLLNVATENEIECIYKSLQELLKERGYKDELNFVSNMMKEIQHKD